MTDKIDDLLADQSAPMYETALLDFARDHDPDLLARFANGLYARVDQDGAFRDIEPAHRRRITLRCAAPAAPAPLAGELTCEAARIPQKPPGRHPRQATPRPRRCA